MARVAFVGPLRDPSGHADEARGFLRALEGAGHAPGAKDVQWTDRTAGVPPAEEAQLRRQCRRGLEGPGVTVHTSLPWRGQPTSAGRVDVARAMFETDRVPPSWVAPLLEREEIWVPSAFNVATFAAGGVPASRLRVLGGTLDFDRFAPGAAPRQLGTEPGRFVFLANFDFSERKGWRQLLTAWAREFTGDDGVCLVLKVGSFYRDDAWVRSRVEDVLAEVAGGQDTAPVHVLSQTLPTRELPGLYAAADAYVLPSRGEGWGRPYMEALAMGLPTVASAWSAVTEFMDPATAWLVEGRVVDVGDDAELFNGLYRGHRWFEADVEHLAAVLREIASDPAAARAKAAPARADLIARFGPEATAARIMTLTEDLLERRASRRVRCVVRGDFGRGHSLAHVNEAYADALEARGAGVLHRARGAAPASEDVPGVSHTWPPDFTPAAQGPAVAVLPWEFGDAPVAWVRAAREVLDRVVVPSRAVRDGFVAAGMPPGVVEVVPNGVEPGVFRPDGPAFPLPVARRAGTVFLFVGGTIGRKGVDVLFEAWARAFTPDDDVLLVVKSHGATGAYRLDSQHEEISAIAASGRTAPVVHLETDLPHEQLPALFRAADVLVHPYRGEGFGLPMLEAMACGLPVVHTAAGPSGEFVPPAAGWGLPSRRVALDGHVDDLELTGPGFWHEPDVPALVAALRAACDPAERRPRGAAAREAALAWSWDAAAARLEAVLDGIAAERLPLARDVATVDLPEARGTRVLFAADWADGASWEPALGRWAAAVPPDADVSLVLPVDPGHADEVVARVTAALADRGHDLEALPDLVLLPWAQDDVAGLVAGVDAVLLDAAQDAVRPARLVRRAVRTIAPGGEAAFAAGCGRREGVAVPA